MWDGRQAGVVLSILRSSSVHVLLIIGAGNHRLELRIVSANLSVASTVDAWRIIGCSLERKVLCR